MTAVLSLLSLLLTVGKGILLRLDRQQLKESGKLEAVYQASLEFQAALEKIRDVDAAILDGDADPDWLDRVRRQAEGSGQ